MLQVLCREEWENRQNRYGVPIRFGRPQAIKKAAGNAAKRGTNASNTLRIIPSGTTLFRQSGMPWVPFTYCEKRSGPTRSQFDAFAPSPKKQPKDYARFTSWSSRLRPNDYWGQQPKKKQRSHPLLCSTHSSFTDDAFLCSPRYIPAAISKTAH